METFFGALIGAMLGVPIAALLMAAVFKPNKSFEVASANAQRMREVVKEANRESGEVPTSFEYSAADDVPIPPDMSLDPNK